MRRVVIAILVVLATGTSLVGLTSLVIPVSLVTWGAMEPPCGECFARDGNLEFIHFGNDRYGRDIEVRFAGVWIKRAIVVEHTLNSARSPAIWNSKRSSQMRIDVPLWMLVVVFAAYPVFRYIQFARNAAVRSRNRHCLGCGYDLTGNMTGRCSECGSPVENEK